MKFKDKYKVSSEFEDLFAFESEQEELEHEAKMLTQQVLNEVARCYSNGPKLKQKVLAEVLGVSTSFISQLYSGDKVLSFPFLAKIQKRFGLNFSIKAEMSESAYQASSYNLEAQNYNPQLEGFWMWKTLNIPDYSAAPLNKIDDKKDNSVA